MRAFVIGLGLLATPAAFAAEVPVVKVATAGDPIWSSNPPPVVKDELVLEEAAKGGGFFSTSGTVEVPEGTILQYVETRSGQKACIQNASNIMLFRSRACFVDADRDGRFDQFSFSEDGKIGALKKPAKYSVRQRSVDVSPPFEARIIYLGATSNTLNLSYREFRDNLARPAFNEELTIPIGSTYPQRVRFKGVEMQILGIDGLGLRYSIAPIAVAP